jgi:uncharacterized protein HemY
LTPETGKTIMLAGAALVGVGLLVYLFHDKLHWIGHLPGDVRIQKGNTRIFIPFTSMIIFSVLATLIGWIIRKF